MVGMVPVLRNKNNVCYSKIIKILKLVNIESGDYIKKGCIENLESELGPYRCEIHVKKV